MKTSIASLLITLCLSSVAQVPLEEDKVREIPTSGQYIPKSAWADSYSVGDVCYCDTNYDTGINSTFSKTPVGILSVPQICTLLPPGPGREGRPVYNDLQCGNGPGREPDEQPQHCPGRVDHGVEGCGVIGPLWKWDSFLCEIDLVWFKVDGVKMSSVFGECDCVPKVLGLQFFLINLLGASPSSC